MKYLIMILGITVFSVRAKCQTPITINEQDYLANAAMSRASYTSKDTTGARALEELAGANATWDFAGRNYVSSSVASTTLLNYPGGAPLADDPDFTASTNVVKSVPSDPAEPTTYTFIKVTSSGEWELGVVQDSLGNVQKLTSYNPPLQQYAFPLTYGTSWASSSSTFTNTLPPGASLVSNDSDVVDGWGSLALPGVQSEPALRIKKSLTMDVSAFGFSSSSTYYFFSWTTLNGESAVISADSELRPNAVSYAVPSTNAVYEHFDPATNPLTLRLSHNPASNGITRLYYSTAKSGNVQVLIMDVLGRNLETIWNGESSAGEHIIPINPSTMNPGEYFIRVQSNGSAATRKLIIR